MLLASLRAHYSSLYSSIAKKISYTFLKFLRPRRGAAHRPVTRRVKQSMKILYDAEADVLSIVLSQTGTAVQEAGEGIHVVSDPEGRLAEVRIQGVAARAATDEVFRQIVLEGIGPWGKADPLIIVPRLFAGSKLVDESG